jgi:hypothetical protein
MLKISLNELFSMMKRLNLPRKTLLKEWMKMHCRRLLKNNRMKKLFFSPLETRISDTWFHVRKHVYSEAVRTAHCISDRYTHK